MVYKLGSFLLGVLSRTSWEAVAVLSSATNALPTLIACRQSSAQEEAPLRQGQAAQRTPPRLQGPYHHIATIRDRPQGLFHALSGGNSSQCYGRHSYRYLFIHLFCCRYARFCCLSCETRRYLNEVARTSHTQPSLDPSSLRGHKKNLLMT
jgi:hypothetical protein